MVVFKGTVLLTLLVTFLKLVLISGVELTAEYEPYQHTFKYVTIGKPLQLACNTDEKADIKWKKDDEDIAVLPKENRHYHTNNTEKRSVLYIKSARDTDDGNYKCQVDDKTKIFTVIVKPLVKVKPKDVSIVDGERLTLKCNALGTQIIVNWILPFNYSEDRVRYEYNDLLENGTLIIENIKMNDRGYYICEARNTEGENKAVGKAFVRVKDKYAALWPFICICVEVFVLCAVILIYEKKRNKTEVDDSETDLAPDIKNGKK